MSELVLHARGPCPLCDTEHHEVRVDFDRIPVLRCRSCGFSFSARTMADADLAHYYREGFGGCRHQQGQVVNARVNIGVIRELLKDEPVRNVLDVGTGYGFLLREFDAHYRAELAGVELSQQEAAYARERLGLPVVCGTLADAGLRRDSFDLVTSMEVIEHVARPVAFIAEMTDHVRPGGHLVIGTDNFEGRTVRALGPRFPKWIPHTHISHFAPATLLRAVAQAGRLKPLRFMSYTPWEFLARTAATAIRREHVDARHAFDLDDALAHEMNGTYRLYTMRRLLNPPWARMTLTDRMNGDMMYLLARRTD